MRVRRRVTPGAAAPWLLLALLPLLSHRGAAQVAPTATLTFNSTADTYVDSGSATTNFNSSTALRADASPTRIIYLRFAVSGLSGRQVQHARLRPGVDLSTHVAWSSNLAGPLGTGAVVTTSLGQGTHTLTATVTDGQGLTGSSQISVTVTPPPPGNTAPLVSITAPASGQTLASSATITFTGSASDLEDGDLTAAIAWTSDRDGALGTGGTITHTLSEGTHQLTATVADRGGLTATATVTVQVVVGVTLEFPAVADAAVDAGLPTTNFGTSPTLAADANLVRNTYLRFTTSGLATRTILGAVLRLQVDATSGAESDSGGTLHTITDGTWQESTITFNNRPPVDGPTVASQGPVQLGQTVDFNLAAAVTGDGTYNFAIVNTSADECDYRSREGGPAPTLIVTVARTAPTVTIAVPAAGSVFFEHDAITFAAHASDADDGDLSSRIEWTSSRDGGLGTGATVTTSGLTVGLHTVTAAVTDSDGLRGQAQASLRVRAPNTPPAVTIASPADGSSVPAGTAVRLGAAASDDFDGDLTGQIRWTSSRDGVLGPNGTRLLSEGAHTLVAAVTDSDGAPGSATARLTVTPTPPVVTMVAPADGTTVFAGTSLAFSGTATDATDGDLSAALRWLSDRDGQIGSGPSFTSTRLSTGTHSITAIAADAGGLGGEAVRRVVVRPPNGPPVVRVVAPAAGTTLLAGKPVLLAATAADVEDGDLGAALVWTSSRDGALGTGRAVVVPGLSVGMHALTASVADRDGATASASVTVTVVPSTLAFSPSADTYVDSGSARAKFGGATSLPVGAL